MQGALWPDPCGGKRVPAQGRLRRAMGEGSRPSLGAGGLTAAFQLEPPREAVFNHPFNCTRSLRPPRKEAKHGHACHASSSWQVKIISQPSPELHRLRRRRKQPRRFSGVDDWLLRFHPIVQIGISIEGF